MSAMGHVTREMLRDGSLAAALRATASVGKGMRSDAELEQTLNAALQSHDPTQDVRVFGYGSLMWNPAFEHVGARPALAIGWSRRFCLWLLMGRGSAQHPGLMLALDEGGDCHGLAFRIPAAGAREELRLLWMREMIGGAYDARWIDLQTDEGPTRGLTFIANRSHARYAGDLTPQETAHYIATGKGRLGTCLSYFEAAHQALVAMNVHDAGIECIRAELARLDTGNGCPCS